MDCLGQPPPGGEKGQNWGLEKLGFPWILSSESSVFNWLRAILGVSFFDARFSPRGSVRPTCSAGCSAAVEARAILRPDSLGIVVRDSLLQSETGRSPGPKPSHHEAAAGFRQDIVGNSIHRFTVTGVGASRTPSARSRRSPRRRRHCTGDGTLRVSARANLPRLLCRRSIIARVRLRLNFLLFSALRHDSKFFGHPLL